MISLYLIGLNKKRNLVSLFHLLTRSGTGGCRFKGPEEGSLKEESYPCYLHDQINFHFYFTKLEIVARFNRCAQAMRNLPHLIEDDWIRLAEVVEHKISLIEEHGGMPARNMGISQDDVASGMTTNKQRFIVGYDLAF